MQHDPTIVRHHFILHKTSYVDDIPLSTYPCKPAYRQVFDAQICTECICYIIAKKLNAQTISD